MKEYIVKVQIMKKGLLYTVATFEISAISASAAKYRVVSLFSEETISDGDGYKILEIIEK